EPELAQHHAIRHRVIALGVIGRDASFVAPEKLHFLPIDAQAKPRREQVVSGGRRRAARETKRELAVRADSLAGYVRHFFGSADVELLRVVEDDQFRFRHKLPCNGRDDLPAERLDRTDWIVSRQMYANDAPAMRFERLEIAERLRLVELREVIWLTGNRNRVATVLRDLQEQAGVRTALVQLSGRMQASRTVAECCRNAVALDDGFANRGDLLLHRRIGRNVRHHSEVVAGPRKIHERGEHRAKIFAAFQCVARNAAGKQRELALLRYGGLRGKLLAARELRKDAAGVVLALLYARLPERLDPHHRGGCHRCDLPAHEFFAQIDFVRQRDKHGRYPGLFDRRERSVLRGIVAAFELEVNEDAVLAVGLRVDQRLVANRNDTETVLA